MKNKLHNLLSIPFVLALLTMCNEPVTNYTTKTIREDSTTGLSRAKEVREGTVLELAAGLEVTLWASDSLAPDPVAMSIDDRGRIYLTRTNRQKNSEFDIRGHVDWMTASISLQSVEDRRNFLKETFATEKSEENSWLKDLNEDGISDWQDLAVEKDEVWRLEDENGNGIADVSTRILDDFNEEISDVAGALLVRENDMFIGIGPDMWRITDSNGDGLLDTKVSIAHGFAVHIGFGGHGMSGAVEGPDGKIYWGIGDIGANITSIDGRNFKYPNQGVLVRSNPDGSDFEVFAAGLRNTHEFVFDEYGNIIGADNDGDHPGESERLVYIVEGHDAGWRTNWQFGKYTDPKNNSYKVWMDEKLFVPRWEGQAAYIIPPIQNFHNGPTGMVYNPGTALGQKWRNKFFLVEFVGTPSRSPIWAFSLKPSGASFELDSEEKMVAGILPTGIRFGPDGALYAADWVNGWNTKNYGRVWRIDVTEDENDLAAERTRTSELMTTDYSKQSIDELYELLFYPDMRIRQKAQFALTSRGIAGLAIFKKAIDQRENQLTRIHGIWGIGQLVRSGVTDAAFLTTLLKDEDPEIIAQATKVIGEVRYKAAGDQLIPLLASSEYRVRFYSAQALGRISHKAAFQPLLDMIEANADEDLYIRHSGVLALSRIGETEGIVALNNHPNRSLRIAAVLTLRRMRHEGVALFLSDSDEYIVTEAARAINDDWSIESALPLLASLLTNEKLISEPLLRRAINAASRVGSQKEIDLLIDFAKRESADAALRSEALIVLGMWESPSVLDRVDGRYRGEVSRDPQYVIAQLTPDLNSFLMSDNNTIVAAAGTLLSNLGITDYIDMQRKLMETHEDAVVRSAMISSLYDLTYQDMEDVIRIGMNDKDAEVRTTALGLLGSMEISAENLPGIVNPIFEKGTVAEQQQTLRVLGEMPINKTEEVLSGLIDRWINKKLSSAVSLDLFEAVDSSYSEKLISKLEPHRSSGTSTEDYMDALYGGNRRSGFGLFMYNSTAQCIRCHDWDEKTNAVAPSLTGVASRLSREQLLEAMIEPSAKLAPGFGSVVLTLKDGSRVSGVLLEENASEIILRTSNAEPLEIALGRIASRQNMPSAMPPVGSILTKREIRDLVEFLSNLED